MNLTARKRSWRFIGVWLGLCGLVMSAGLTQLSGTGITPVPAPLVGGMAVGGPSPVAPPPSSREQVLHAYGNLPLRFVENRGQTNARVRYHAQGPRYTFFLTREEIVLSFARRSRASDSRGASEASFATRGSTARPPALGAPAAGSADAEATEGITLALRFVGANPQAALEGEERAPGAVNYLRGNDPARWHTQLPHYAQVVYRELWPGVDLMLRGQRGELKYEFRVRPGARLSDIALGYRGSTGLALDGEGGLLIDTAWGVLRDSPPVSYQEISGERVPVESRYVLTGKGDAEHRYGFAVGAGYDPDRALIVDPGLDYSTFLGGAGGDAGNGIAVDAAGNAYVVGTTQSLDFPTTAGAFDRTPGDTFNGPDAFVSKLNATGSALVYSTYLGGGGFDFGRAIAIDAAGNAYVTGKTQSANFPTTAGAFDRTANFIQTPRPQGIDDGFVAKLNAAGSALVYSTYLGGVDNDEPRAIALDAAGNAYVAGETVSADFPVTAGAFDTVRSGEYDAFVTKLNTAGSALVYSTFLGGLVSENADGLAVDSANQVFLVGSTRSDDFPTTAGAFDTTHNGLFDAYVTKLDATGSALIYSTFLGGADGDFGGDLDIDGEGNAYVVGGTLSPEFPTTPGAFDTIFPSGGSAGFVVKLNAFGSAIVYSTFLRGGGASAIAVDPAGNAWMTGGTSAPDFPTTPDGFDRSFNGGSDVIVFQLNAAGSALIYSTFVGGSDLEGGSALALDVEGNIYVTGETRSTDFPTTPSALDRVWNGDPLIFWADGFVFKLSVASGPPPPPPSSPTLSALTVSPSSVAGGASSTGTVALSAAAPGGGAVVQLSSNNGAATVPASVTVAAGATTATFTVNTTAVGSSTTVTISGTLTTTRSATLTVTPPPVPAAPTLQSPANDATPAQPVTLDWNNVANATSYEVQVDNSSTIAAPFIANPTVTVSQVTLGGLPAQQLWWRVRARNSAGVAGPFSSTRRFTPQAASGPASLSAVSVNPTSVVGGASSTGTVTLTGAAPTGGALVTLSSNNAAAAVPASVTVASGATTATFAVTTTTVTTATTATITGAYGGATRSAMLTVNPAGAAVTLTVTATGRSGERITSSPAGINVTVGSTGSASFTSGTVITLSATNGRDTVWSGACSSGGNKTRTCRFTITGNASVTGNVQ
jgi:hypothetical protein